MKYQIIKNQIAAKKFNYTVEFFDEERSQYMPQCRFSLPHGDRIRYNVYNDHTCLLPVKNLEYEWDTQAEAQMFINDYIADKKEWEESEDNPKNWEKPKIVKAETIQL